MEGLLSTGPTPSSFYIQGSKFGGKINKFGRKSKTKLRSTEFMEFVFFQVWDGLS